MNSLKPWASAVKDTSLTATSCTPPAPTLISHGGGSSKIDSTKPLKSKAGKALSTAEVKAMLADPTDVPARKPSIGEARAAETSTDKPRVVKPATKDCVVLRPDHFTVVLASNITQEVKDHMNHICYLNSTYSPGITRTRQTNIARAILSLVKCNGKADPIVAATDSDSSFNIGTSNNILNKRPGRLVCGTLAGDMVSLHSNKK